MDLCYLELEGQGRGIITEVTSPLLLGPFYLVKWPVNPNILAASVGLVISIKFKMQHYKILLKKKIWFCMFEVWTSTCKRISKCKSLYQKYAQIPIQMLLKVQFLTKGCKKGFRQKVLGLNLN